MKFYKNRSTKNKRFFISGSTKNDDGSKNWYYLNKSQEFNNDLYLDIDAFKDGLEIDSKNLKRLEKGSSVLVFASEEEEKKYCIDKAEIEKRKENRKNTKTIDDSIYTYINDIIKELVLFNDLYYKEDGIVAKAIAKINAKADELTPISDEENDLPF